MTESLSEESPRPEGWLQRLISAVSNSYLLLRFIMDRAGREYGIGRLQKASLVTRILRNHARIPSLTSWQQHLILIEEIFRIPKAVSGEVVECGCYYGATTANLSLACAMTGRRLIVCDSFEGLPEVREDERIVVRPDSPNYYRWEAGEFSVPDGVEGVKKRVARFGCVEVCRFVKGYFKDTLPHLPTESIVLVFEDADLRSSVEDCLRYLWPKLRDGCKFYCHEPWSIQVVSLFYDHQWWRDQLGMQPPGFFGSGCGLGAGLGYSWMGYAVKFDPEQVKAHGKKIMHLGSKGFDK